MTTSQQSLFYSRKVCYKVSMKTPFEEIVLTNHRNLSISINPKLANIYKFGRELRLKYMDMYSTSVEVWEIFDEMRNGQRIGIGLTRTGTTSLNEALLELGYFAIHYPLDDDIIDRADALTDIPVAYRYKELDKKYPGSKFVLTKRALVPWLKSMLNHYKRKPGKSRGEETQKHRINMFGTIYFDLFRFIKVHFVHTQDVRNYFKGRSNDFLEIDITKGERWQELCRFLGKKVPDKPFPKVNTAKQVAIKDEFKKVPQQDS
jgi:hypothetical protein